jgi:hypothetical protein
VDSFLNAFVKRAYRRPPLPEETKILRDAYDAGRQTDFKTGIKTALMVVLQSPQFLYRIEVGQPRANATDSYVQLTPYEVATRLSYLLWKSQPDSTLMTAADNKQLSTPEQIAAQVQRMLIPTPGMPTINAKAKAMVQGFHDQWLALERLPEVQKDMTVFKTSVYTTEHLTLMQQEAYKFLDEAFWGTDNGNGTLAALLTGQFTWIEPKLYKLYTTDPASKTVGGFTGTPPMNPAMGAAPLQRVTTDGVIRGGFLTLGAPLVMLAHADQTSPVHRGKFVREQLLCQMLPPPPNDVMIVVPPLNPNLTTRERFSMHMNSQACFGCHSLMDPIGLGFERFDAIGRYRTTENNKPVDDSGEVMGMTAGKFNGVVDLEKKLAANEQTAECVARQWFRFAYGREEEDKVDDCTLELLKRKFIASGLKFRDLLVALTQTDAFLYRPAGGGQ